MLVVQSGKVPLKSSLMLNRRFGKPEFLHQKKQQSRTPTEKQNSIHRLNATQQSQAVRQNNITVSQTGLSDPRKIQSTFEIGEPSGLLKIPIGCGIKGDIQIMFGRQRGGGASQDHRSGRDHRIFHSAQYGVPFKTTQNQRGCECVQCHRKGDA